MSGPSPRTTPMQDAPDLHARCSRMVDQANSLSAPSHPAWEEVPQPLANALAAQLSRIHINALSLQAWIEADGLSHATTEPRAYQLEIYLNEAQRFLDIVEKVSR